VPTPATPDCNCPLCPRLVDFRQVNRAAFPGWHNAPVPSFGGLDAKLLVVGLAPGLRGANRTGRPFTGDYAGDLLYATLLKVGLARGNYDKRADDGLELLGVRITNAVRCVPPENKPTGVEARTCRPFLVDEMALMPKLKGVLALGQLAHTAVVATLGLKQVATKFAHGAIHPLPGGRFLADSYHCSRYNTNTGTLTEEMFHAVVADVARRVSA